MVTANNNGNTESILTVILMPPLDLFVHQKMNAVKNIEAHLLFRKNNQKRLKYFSKNFILHLQLTFTHTETNGYTPMPHLKVKIRFKNIHYILFTKI